MLEVHQRSGLIVWQCGVVVVNLVMIIMIIMKIMKLSMISIREAFIKKIILLLTFVNKDFTHP